jgi:metallophosphoesterase (TIGR03767 family)
VLTTVYTIQPASEQRGAYHKLAHAPGEPHVLRLDLLPVTSPPRRARRSLVHFVQLTDIHTVDVQSPGRFEFFERFSGQAESFHVVVPAHRPQEALNLHALEATIRTVNILPPSSETGAPLQFVLCTGDNTDNAQANELQQFIALMSGRIVASNSGGPAYEGVQACDWGDPEFWHPDGCPDHYKQRWEFPSYPGLLEEAVQSFQAEGCRLPWFSCYGNHDAFVLGTAIPTPTYQHLVIGGLKPYALPPGFDPLPHLSMFSWQPERFLGGPARAVTPDPQRRIFQRREFIEKHFHATGEPSGHGFTAQNRRDATAYYATDIGPDVRLIVLDTVHPSGYYTGSIGSQQYRWLEQQLIDVHSHYYAPNGSLITTGATDRLVILCSHHGLRGLTNDTIVSADLGSDADLPRLLAPMIEGLLHRFPNVILWVNGHTHCNTVQPHPHPAGRLGGFWEITTASIIDWPSQARCIEIIDNENGTLSVLCTMVEHNAPPAPEVAEGVMRLASIHRELAANDPHAGITAQKLYGQPTDRNVELLLPHPWWR